MSNRYLLLMASPPSLGSQPPLSFCCCTFALNGTVSSPQKSKNVRIRGVLPTLQSYYAIGDAASGLLGTATTVVSLVAIILMGIAGDRVPRRTLLLGAMGVWVPAAGASGYVPRQLFWLYGFLRAITAIGSASLNVLIPPTIGDYFEGPARGYAIMFYSATELVANFAAVSAGSIIVGAGLEWQWTLRMAPPLAALALVAVYFSMPEPVRGEHDAAADIGLLSHGLVEDLRSLLKVKTYTRLVASMFFTAVAGLIQVSWGPSSVQRAMDYRNYSAEIYHGLGLPMIQSIISASNIATYLIGVFAATVIVEYWKGGRGIFTRCQSDRAAPLTKAIGVALSFLFYGLNLLSAAHNLPLFFAFFAISTFFGAVSLPLSTRIILDVVPPNRRSLAMATKSLALTFLTAPIPLVFGSVVDLLRNGREDASSAYFALLWAMLGAVAFSSITAPLTILFVAASYPTDVVAMRRETAEVEEEAVLVMKRSRCTINGTI